MKDPENKLTVIKTIRFSETLLRNIGHECEKRSLAFSDFVRLAAISAMEQKKSHPQSQLG